MRGFQLLGSVLDRLSAVLGAFVMSQFPAFIQQYTQRLSGHVDELTRLLNTLKQSATLSNKTLEEYIQKFQSSIDADFARQGEFMNGILARWKELNHALDQLVHSSLWERPFVFMRDLQGTIVHSTYESFQPGFNFTVEGLVYAASGMMLGLSAYHLLTKGLAFGFSRMRRYSNVPVKECQ